MNYNVRHFLEQCLYSVEKSLHELEAEIIVVDNHSTDGSVEYLRPRFPGVRFIVNEDNKGFASGCNQGLKHAGGKFILFLNPDTILAEDSLQKCLQFFETHPGCGGLGVQMIDGSGRFLKESKRSFPSPFTSLFKLFGLSRLFPRSRVFSRYHLGHLHPGQDHEVDVLAGAFMMVPKKVLMVTGGFDETFFMYGEDIDLSYRIQQAGFKNYYFSGTTIIHFKGESTRKGSLNYVKMFYTAMNIFVRKHYAGTKAGFFSASIHLAIWLRAVLAAMHKFLSWMGLPVLDALLILFSFWMAKEVWTGYVRTDISYAGRLFQISFPLFTLAYLIVAYYAGLYDRYYRGTNLIRSTTIATLSLLALYALLPENMRFSRAIVVLGALLAFILITISRMLLIRWGLLQQPAEEISNPYILVAGSPAEYKTVIELLDRKGLSDKVIGRISTGTNGNGFISHLDRTGEAAATLNAREIIFCNGQLTYAQTIKEVQKLKNLRFRFFAGCSIIGSDDSAHQGEILSGETGYRLGMSSSRRMKRLLDVLFSLIALLSFPIQMVLVRRPVAFFRNCFLVLLCQRTWVGYLNPASDLPPLRKGVLGPNGIPRSFEQSLPAELLKSVDYWYAREYLPSGDVRVILRNYRYLGH